MFFATTFLTGMGFSVLLPESFNTYFITLNAIEVNVPGIVGIILGGLVATSTFRASLTSKTGKLYRPKENNENHKQQLEQDKNTNLPE